MSDSESDDDEPAPPRRGKKRATPPSSAADDESAARPRRARPQKFYDYDTWADDFLDAIGQAGLIARHHGGNQREKVYLILNNTQATDLETIARLNPEMVRPNHRYRDDERGRQALRWVSTVFLANFPKGAEIQCYFDAGTVYVASNDRTTNNQIAAAVARERAALIGYVQASYERLVEEQGTAATREKRHFGKLLAVAGDDDAGHAGQHEVIDALKAGRIQVVTIGDNGLHAERRIKAHFEAVGQSIDLRRLAGVKRPCFVCALALGVADGNAGPLWPSQAATMGYTPDQLADHVRDCTDTAKLISLLTRNRITRRVTTDFDSDSESDVEDYETPDDDEDDADAMPVDTAQQ